MARGEMRQASIITKAKKANFTAASPGQGAEDGADEAIGALRAPQTQSPQTLRSTKNSSLQSPLRHLKLLAQSGGRPCWGRA